MFDRNDDISVCRRFDIYKFGVINANIQTIYLLVGCLTQCQ